jgi:hypothetical protein
VIPCRHPTVLCHMGWIVEADKERERELKSKRTGDKDKKKKKPNLLGDEDEELDKSYYCVCHTVCSSCTILRWNVPFGLTRIACLEEKMVRQGGLSVRQGGLSDAFGGFSWGCRFSALLL